MSSWKAEAGGRVGAWGGGWGARSCRWVRAAADGCKELQVGVQCMASQGRGWRPHLELQRAQLLRPAQQEGCEHVDQKLLELGPTERKGGACGWHAVGVVRRAGGWWGQPMVLLVPACRVCRLQSCTLPSVSWSENPSRPSVPDTPTPVGSTWPAAAAAAVSLTPPLTPQPGRCPSPPTHPSAR